MIKFSQIITVVLFLIASTAVAEDYIGLVKDGNEAYRKSDYKKALEYYHSAETDLPASPQLEYNMAGALYQQGGYEEAVDKYKKALEANDARLEADASYNLGNTYYRMGDYQNAIASYENTLKLYPDEVDAKYNLELARKMLKEQIKPDQKKQDKQQQQQQNQQQNQDQQQQQQNQQQQQKQDSEQQQNQGQEGQNQQQEQQQQDQQKDQQQSKQPAGEEKQMSKEDAERILNALNDDERELQKDVKRQVVASDYTGNDW